MTWSEPSPPRRPPASPTAENGPGTTAADPPRRILPIESVNQDFSPLLQRNLFAMPQIFQMGQSLREGEAQIVDRQIAAEDVETDLRRRERFHLQETFHPIQPVPMVLLQLLNPFPVGVKGGAVGGKHPSDREVFHFFKGFQIGLQGV